MKTMFLDIILVVSTITTFFLFIGTYVSLSEYDKRVEDLERKIKCMEEEMEEKMEFINKRLDLRSEAEDPDERRRRYLRRLGDEMFLRAVEKGEVNPEMFPMVLEMMKHRLKD